MTDGDRTSLARAAAAMALIAAILLSALPAAGLGTFGPPDDYPVDLSPFHVAVGDVNGDGTRDIVAANEEGDSVSVLRGRPNGTFRPAVDYEV
jgi:hypothetical protein